MPYRRLPNTDAARMRALCAAHEMGGRLHPTELAYSQELYTELTLFINSFALAMDEYRTAYDRQSESSAGYQRLTRMAKLYISHFIQVMNMAILRGELKEEVREFYGFARDQGTVPGMTSDEEVELWGKRIIDGEFQRTSRGASPMQNPSVAMLRIHYDQFIDALNRQRILQQNTSRALSALSELRPRADILIKNIWDEVEVHFGELIAPDARERCREYGLVYVYRKNELLGEEGDGQGGGLLSADARRVAQSFRKKSSGE